LSWKEIQNRRPPRASGQLKFKLMTPAKFKPVEEQLAYLKKGVAEIIPEAELKANLKLPENRQTPASLSCVDPLRPISSGHTVVLRKLRHFQDLGHTRSF